MLELQRWYLFRPLVVVPNYCGAAAENQRGPDNFLPPNPTIDLLTSLYPIAVPFKGLYRVILGLYRDNGKENGNYYLGFRV